MLVSLALGDANFLRRPCTFLFLCVDFSFPVEYRWRWVLALGLCVGHVHFIFFVLIFVSDANPFFGGIWALGIEIYLFYQKLIRKYT